MKPPYDKILFNKSDRDIVIAGHRGLCAQYPENTMLSYRKAIEAGVDQLEIDVNMTRDRRLVLMHDPSVDRTTERSGRIRSYTLDEMKQMDAGSHKDYRFRGERVPEFRELLEYIADTDISLNVEIKDYQRCGSCSITACATGSSSRVSTPISFSMCTADTA